MPRVMGDLDRPTIEQRVSARRRVLFVDDDDLMRTAFARAMASFEFDVETASSGAEAVARIQARNYPVVVTDLRMPGIDGIALIEQINTLRPEVAFVLVTADPHPNIARNERVDAAIASVVEKPLYVEDFARTLEHAFEFQQKRVRTMSDGRRGDTNAPSVLLVEDDPVDAQLISDMLRGYHVQTVRRLSDALRMIHDQHFETILAQVALPDARGIDTVIRLQASAPDAAIIAISSVDDDAQAQQMIQLGAQDYLCKQQLGRRTLVRAISFGRERSRAQQRLLQLAHYDQLTGLANRTSFVEHVTRIASRARRLQQRVGVMLLDLDGFKAVNDTHGHEAGDLLLQEISHRVRQVFREYDVVARLGGDEFAILLTEVEGPSQIASVAERLLSAIAQPVWVGESYVGISASIGGALFPDTAESIAALLKCSDAAMYQVKRAGKNGFRMHEREDVPPRLSSSPPPPPVSEIHELTALDVLPRSSARD
jgi:two-component system cell cycle response regulator